MITSLFSLYCFILGKLTNAYCQVRRCTTHLRSLVTVDVEGDGAVERGYGRQQIHMATSLTQGLPPRRRMPPPTFPLLSYPPVPHRLLSSIPWSLGMVAAIGIGLLEFLSDSEVAAVDDMVDSSICRDAHADEPWILALVELIRRQHASGKHNLDRRLIHPLGMNAEGKETNPYQESSGKIISSAGLC